MHKFLLIPLMFLTGCGNRAAAIAPHTHSDLLSTALIWLIILAIVGCGVFAGLMYFGAMVPGGAKACMAGIVGCSATAALGIVVKSLLPYALYGSIGLVVIAAIGLVIHYRAQIKAELKVLNPS